MTGSGRRRVRVSQPTQWPDDQRVVLESGRLVEEPVQPQVVPARGHAEPVVDRLLLRAGVLPPLALKGQDLAVLIGEHAGDGTSGVRQDRRLASILATAAVARSSKSATFSR